MTTAEDYQYLVYRGDDFGGRGNGGKLFWAVCVETGDRGHSISASIAIGECMRAVDGRLEILAQQGIAAPRTRSIDLSSVT